MPERVSVNGRLTSPEEAAVSPLDRGFLYGDSVYETIRAYAGRPFRLQAHLLRLRRSADRIEIPWDGAPIAIEREVQRVLAEAGLPEAAVRVILTRGPGPVDYDPERAGPPTVVIHVREAPAIPRAWRAEGVDIAVVGVVRNPAEAIDPAVKSSNLLNNLLAWKEARRLGAYEAILLNSLGRLAEGASSNLFLVRGGGLLTPAEDCGILPGITRELVLDLARREGIDAREAHLAPEDLRTAEEAFLTSTLKEVLPVRRCDGWPVHDGRPGPVTKTLMALYEGVVQAETKAGSVAGSSFR